MSTRQDVLPFDEVQRRVALGQLAGNRTPDECRTPDFTLKVSQTGVPLAPWQMFGSPGILYRLPIGHL